MIEILKKVTEYILIGLILLGIIIVYGTLRAKAFNLLILTTGVALIILPILVFLIMEKISDRRNPKIKKLRDLKLNGKVIPVDLTKCKIKSNNWTNTNDRYENPRISFLNEISGHGEKNIELTEVNLSRVEYVCLYNGKKRTFLSPTIAKDKVTLMILLEMKKETSIYVDRKNSKYYFFDLDFLKN